MNGRRRWLRESPPRPGGRYVLYWMRMAKRARDNLALEEAIRRADELGLPVAVYEGLSHQYPGANRRIHRFILEAARDTARGLRSRGIPYLFHLRRGPDDPAGALLRAAREAALVVVDEFPAYVWPLLDRALVEGTARAAPPVVAVDDTGVVPMDEFAERDADGVPRESVDAFLEQLVVRRELAYNFCRHTPPAEHASLAVLPEWARRTLAEHADDPRPRLYAPEALERAETHDPVWNAAQRELFHTGTIHGYLRMLWGKHVIRWTPTHRDALRVMVDLHQRYALDGRDPNTYANVLWCFGLHDRAFGATEVLGKTRPMTTRSTRRKFDLEPYFRRVDRWEERAREGHG